MVDQRTCSRPEGFIQQCSRTGEQCGLRTSRAKLCFEGCDGGFHPFRWRSPAVGWSPLVGGGVLQESTGVPPKQPKKLAPARSRGQSHWVLPPETTCGDGVQNSVLAAALPRHDHKRATLACLRTWLPGCFSKKRPRHVQAETVLCIGATVGDKMAMINKLRPAVSVAPRAITNRGTAYTGNVAGEMMF